MNRSVRDLQTRLNTKGAGLVVDGQFGPATARFICARMKAVKSDAEFDDLKLSANFTLGELLHSNTARRRGIANLPNAKQLLALRALAINILQPVRDHYCAAVKVTSGLRGGVLNRLVGGSLSSQHCKGEAADFTVEGVSNKAVCVWIRDNLKFDQLIYEFGEGGWVHCSFSRVRSRRDWKSAVKRGRKTRYLGGVFTQ